MATYPRDADGDALRRVAEEGSDMSRPMVVDFMIATGSESAGRAIAAAVGPLGYATSVELDGDGRDRWTVYCTRTMALTYESVIAAQRELDAAARPLGGYSDGWGTFGNKDE